MKNFSNVKELETFLREANAAYRSGNSVISDLEYDEYEDLLRSWDPDNSFLSELDDDSSIEASDDGFGAEEDLTLKMGSQAKAKRSEEMSKLYNAVSAVTHTTDDDYHASYKIDGNSLELTYIDGKFVKALTRGKGFRGRNVSFCVEKMQGVPKEIPMKGKVVIRGESVLPISNLEKINQILIEEGQPVFTSPRNSGTAICTSKKHERFAHFMQFIAYDLALA